MTKSEAQAGTKWPTHVIRSGAHTPNLNGSDLQPDDPRDHVEPFVEPRFPFQDHRMDPDRGAQGP